MQRAVMQKERRNAADNKTEICERTLKTAFFRTFFIIINLD